MEDINELKRKMKNDTRNEVDWWVVEYGLSICFLRLDYKNESNK